MSKLVVAGVSGAILAAGLGVLIYARGDEPSPPAPRAAARGPAPAASRASAGERRPEAVPAGYLALVIAENTVDVASKLEGRLARVHVKLGQRIEAGQSIASLDASTVKSQIDVMQAQLRAARAEMRQARLQLAEARERLARRQKLGAIISDEELAEARIATQVAQERLQQARAAADQAQTQVEQAKETGLDLDIRAPFAGLVAQRYADGGKLVHPGERIVRLISGDGLLVRFAVPAEDAPAITVGKSLQVQVEGVPTPLPGSIETVAPEIDSALRLLLVEGKLAVPEPLRGIIPSGARARVALARLEPPG